MNKQTSFASFKELITVKNIKWVIGVIFASMMLILNTLVTMTSMKKMGLFLACVLCLVFLHYPPKRGSKKEDYKPGIFDIILAILGASVGLYTYFFIDGFFARYFMSTPLDIAFGVLAVLLILEAGRRVVGNVLPILSIIALIYAYFGSYVPGAFQTGNFTMERIIEFLYMRAEGIYGVTLRTAASYIALFIIFGAIVNETSVGDYLIRLSQTIAGKDAVRFGEAKNSSGLMGTVSGSPIANVVTTGTFTIPLMKSSGFDTEMAGAVEAAASTGGSLMPPIMASAAFIMAEYLGIPYSTIALAALVPAICYYLSIYINVHLYSKKHQLVGMKEVPAWRDVIKDMYLLIPLAAVFITIFAGKTPLNAALWGIISCVAVSFFRKKSRITPKRFINALGKSSLTGLEAYMACIIVGIPVGVIVMTGLGRVLADLVVGVSGAQLYLMLLISAIAALLMSMGLPTVPLYIVCATTIAPALVSLGILPLAAHLFVLYWGVLSNLTPPVALASYAAAGLCGGDLNQVAWKALKLTLPTFLIPFAFVLNPGILFQGDVLNIIQTCFTITLGSGALAVAVAGYTHRPLKSIERMLIAVGAVLLIDPRGFTDLIGGSLILVMLVIVFAKKKETAEIAA